MLYQAMNKNLSTQLERFNQFSLIRKALIASAMGWFIALCISVIYCVYYMRYVNSEDRGLLESILWLFQEYGVWLVLTPALLVGLSQFSNKKRMGWFWFLVILTLFVSISFRLLLDFYLNPSAQFIPGLVYFTPDHIFITIIVLLGWALVFRKSEIFISNGQVYHAQLPDVDPTVDKLDAYKGNRKVSITIDSILIVSAAGNYVELHCLDNQYLMRSTMKELEEKLTPYQFIRIHRSHLVNPGAIKSVEADALVLTNGERLVISQRYRNNLIRYL